MQFFRTPSTTADADLPATLPAGLGRRSFLGLALGAGAVLTLAACGSDAPRPPPAAPEEPSSEAGRCPLHGTR